MKARLITTRVVRVACPNCGEPAGTVNHILDGFLRSFGPWYCNECGRSYHGELLADGEIEVHLGDEIKVVTLDHLVLPPQDKPITSSSRA
jgi:ribosomal protein L37AE/L43A